MNPIFRVFALGMLGLGVATAFFWGGLALHQGELAKAGGVVVEKFNSVPPGFPSGIIPTGVPLRYSQITSLSGQKTWQIAMESRLSMPAQMSALTSVLREGGFEIADSRIGASGFIEAKKNGESLSASVTVQEKQTGLLVVVLTYGPIAQK